ncbi:MAG: hypothetical protein ACR2I8_11575 [Steroidobacteraceae bacterium]
MHIELLMTVLAGLAGGLCGTLWSSLVSSSLFLRWPALRPEAWRAETASRLLAGAALHGACGALAGLLFWLSWGLIAVVGWPWPAVGAAYGGLLWTAGALPSLATLALRARRDRPALAVAALEGLVGCLAAGLLCAYAWHRSA